MADLVISVDIDAKGARKGEAEAKAAVKGIGDEAEKTGRKVRSLANRDLQALQKNLELVKGFVAGAGVALAALAAGAVAVTQRLFDLAKEASAYGAKISDASTKTGLTAEAIQGLKHAAEQSGSSFDTITNSIAKFNVMLGEAREGNKKALETLKAYNITTLDSTEAVKQAIKTINDLQTADRKAAAAKVLFKDETGDIIPVIQGMNGNLDGQIQRLSELGVLMDGKSVASAKRFDRQMAELNLQLDAVKRKIGIEVMPVFLDMASRMSDWLSRNQGEVNAWARRVGIAFDNVITGGERLLRLLDALASRNVFKLGLVIGDVVTSYDRDLQKKLDIARKNDRLLRSVKDTNLGSVIADGTVPPIEKQTKEMTDAEKQAKRLADMIQDLALRNKFFGQTTEVAAVQQRLLAMGIQDMTKGLPLYALQIASGIDRLNEAAEAAKKADEAAKALRETLAGRLIEIEGRGKTDRVGLNAEIQALVQQIALGRELTDVERAHIENRREQAQLEVVLNDLRAKGADPVALAVISDALVTEQKETLKLIELYQKLKEQREAQQAFKDLSADMAAEIADLNVRLGINSVLTEENRIRQLLLTDAYKGLKEEQQKKLIEDAKQIDALREAVKAQEEAQRAYDDFFHTIRDGLDAARGGFRNFFSWVKDRFTQFLTDLIAEWLTSKFFDMFFKGGNQRVAQQNGQGSGGILGSIFGSNGVLGSIFGSGSGSGGGTPGFNPGYFNSAGGGGGIGPRVPGSVNMTLPNGSPSSGGGLFGGGLSGTLTGIGAGANVVGGLIGGRAGGFISNIGTGLALGAQIGSIIPGVGTVVGAVVGAAVGFFASLFGGDPKRKRDKKEKIPALNKGFTDALAQLRQLIVDTRTLRVSPDAALSRAIELRSAIASGFDIQFESKKYRKQAQTMIASKLREADALIAELRTAAEIARAASERDRRILPEFAKGVYLSPAFQAFRRQNGMLAGQWTGRDTIPAMLARGEMVLNPHQQDRVRSNAGFDVFKTAGIPGYAAGGVVTGQPTIQPVLVRDDQPISVQISVQQDATGMFSLSARSPQGRKVLLEVVGDGFRNDEVKTKRR